MVAAGNQPATEPYGTRVAPEGGRPQRPGNPDADNQAERIFDIARYRHDGNAAQYGQATVHGVTRLAIVGTAPSANGWRINHCATPLPRLFQLKRRKVSSAAAQVLS